MTTASDSQNAVVTVVGLDKAGIIAKVATLLADENVNIIDVSQTLMGDIFTMSMLIDGTNVSDFTDLQEKLTALGQTLGLEIRMQREAIFKAMSQI
jgi:ACT domain-containing protein